MTEKTLKFGLRLLPSTWAAVKAAAAKSEISAASLVDILLRSGLGLPAEYHRGRGEYDRSKQPGATRKEKENGGPTITRNTPQL